MQTIIMNKSRKFGKEILSFSRNYTFHRVHFFYLHPVYAVNLATELLCLRDHSYALTNDVVFSKDELNDLLSTALCD